MASSCRVVRMIQNPRGDTIDEVLAWIDRQTHRLSSVVIDRRLDEAAACKDRVAYRKLAPKGTWK